MRYEVEFTELAEADLASLDNRAEEQVRSKIAEMASSADIWRHTALTGPFRGYCRLRVGDYRVLYVNDRTNRRISVHREQHRSEVYRRS